MCIEIQIIQLLQFYFYTESIISDLHTLQKWNV